VEAEFAKHNVEVFKIGSVVEGNSVTIKNNADTFTFNVSEL
jgi:phosphoribosylformylglycinamidine synthase